MRNRGLFFLARRASRNPRPAVRRDFRATGERFLVAGMALLVVLLFFLTRESRAQVPGLGMGWILNPEGSRLFPQAIIYPRHPGKPDTRWKVFDWHFRDVTVDRAGYRLYFYDVSERPGDPHPFWTAEFAEPVIRLQIEELARDFRFWPPERFSYILFSSYREFQQANVFFIQEGVQGITSTREPTMAIPYWGERETFRHISHHELVHQFQVQKMAALAGDRSDAPELLLPLWFIEGMAEFYSLRGVDAEARALLRDLWFNPPEDDSKKQLEDFFEPGPMDFQHVYKLGQLKNAFLEERFGRGTIQRVLEDGMAKLGSEEAPTFAQLVARTTGKPVEELQTLWRSYFVAEVVGEFDRATDLSGFRRIEGVPDRLDHYAVSPDGSWLFTREVDPLTGEVSLQLAPLAHPERRQQVTHDHQGSAVSLYFFQAPALAVTTRRLAFMALTAEGPELELREVRPDGSTGDARRVRLYEQGLVQAHSPAFSPDGESLVFVGINSKGWQNLYVLGEKRRIRKLTRGASSWRNPSWTTEGILVSSDRVPGTDLYGIFMVDPVRGSARLLARPDLRHDNLLEPAAIRPSREVFFRSTNGTGQQIHRRAQGGAPRHVTRVRTQMIQPQLVRTGERTRLLALGFEKGRYRLYELPPESWAEKPDRSDESAAGGAESAELAARAEEPAPDPAPGGHGESVLAAAPPPGTDVRAFPRSEIRQYRSFTEGSGMRI